jgi:uncharacterized protein (DUF305 family)
MGTFSLLSDVNGKEFAMSAFRITKGLLLGSALAATLSLSSLAQAVEYEPGGRDTHETVAYAIDLVSKGTAGDPALLQTDLAYVTGMRTHHAGALTMAEAYLAQGQNPILRRLAQAIITNQRFEIAVLDDVTRKVQQQPKVLLDFGQTQLVLRPLATEGLEHRQAFIKAPPPSVADYWMNPEATVSAYDVRWAKAMIVHHQGALDMAKDYNADPNGRNSFLRLLNLDILRDQTYEIGFLEGLIGRYPGDATAIAFDPAMVHGMPMNGHGHGEVDHQAMGH